MYVLKGSFLLNFPSAELMSSIGVSVTFYFAIDSHKLQYFFHFGETGPKLYLSFCSFLFFLKQSFLVKSPYLSGSKSAINHQYLSDEEFRSTFVKLSVLVFSWFSLIVEDWRAELGGKAAIEIINNFVHWINYMPSINIYRDHPSFALFSL